MITESAKNGQEELFHDTLGDALRAVVYALGGPKKVAGELWPEKSAKVAADLLLHCLDDERPEKLDLEQILWLLRAGRHSGIHNAMLWLGKTLGYEIEPIEPESELAKLQRRYIDAVATMKDLTRQIGENTAAMTGKLRRVA